MGDLTKGNALFHKNDGIDIDPEAWVGDYYDVTYHPGSNWIGNDRDLSNSDCVSSVTNYEAREDAGPAYFNGFIDHGFDNINFCFIAETDKEAVVYGAITAEAEKWGNIHGSNSNLWPNCCTIVVILTETYGFVSCYFSTAMVHLFSGNCI